MLPYEVLRKQNIAGRFSIGKYDNNNPPIFVGELTEATWSSLPTVEFLDESVPSAEQIQRKLLPVVTPWNDPGSG